MAQPGRHRLFVSANIAILIVAGLHTWGTLSGAPVDAEGRALEAAMKAYTVPVGLGMTPSPFDITRSLSLCFTISLIAIAMLSLGTLRWAAAAPGLIRRISGLDVLILTAMVLLYGVLRIAPPFVTLAVVDVLFVLAWLKEPRAA